MNKMFLISCLILVATQLTKAQHDYTTPVPILKQIDRHNDDGSYTYGYEAADKSFKIETKYPTGEVFGKYGYVDDQGQVREIEYGASKRGFEPAGSHINVPPPTLTNSNPYPLGPNEIDDGQYREDPAIYFKDEKYNRPIAASTFSLDNNQYQQPRPQPQYHNPAPQYFQQPVAPAPAPQPNYQPNYQPANQQPYYQAPQARNWNPQPQYNNNHYNNNQYNNHYNSAPSHHHPAVKSLDLWSGSYSIDYTGRK